MDHLILFSRQRKSRFFNMWLMRSDGIVFQLVVNQSKSASGRVVDGKLSLQFKLRKWRILFHWFPRRLQSQTFKSPLYH